MTIGKLTRVPLREVWKREAADFTTWMEQNVDALSEVLDLNIASAEREKSAGDFSVDLVGEDEDGNTIVIENQLEKSDHDHLGKVLTYLTALDAKAAVWVVSRPRPEHIKAIAWLNEATSTPFYLVQIEAVCIGDSAPAPLFTRIVGPSLEARTAGQVKKDLSDRHIIRRRFWEQLLEVARERSQLFSRVSASKDNWIAAGAGRSGLVYNYVVRQHEMQVELYFNSGDPDANRMLFDELRRSSEAIEAKFRVGLDWQPLEGKQICRVCHRLPDGGWRDEERWPEIIDRAVEAMCRLEAAFKPHVRRLKGDVVAAG